MNKNLRLMYKWILKLGATAKVERIKDGIYVVALYRDMPGHFASGTKPYQGRRVFYLHPRNPYTGEFDYE